LEIKKQEVIQDTKKILQSLSKASTNNRKPNVIPKVTIIVPMYNVEPYISHCVTSLINQQYQNIEIFLINDCSRDKTGMIADEFHKKYPDKITVIHNSKNVGTYKSINLGIIKSSGDYITIIGADDVFTKNKVQEQVNVLTNYKNIVSCYCLYERRHYLTGKVLVQDVGESTIMFRRGVIHRIGYYDSVRFGADSEYRDRIKRVYGKQATKVIKKVLYIALFRPDSLTSSGRSKNGSILRKKYRNNFTKWHKSDRRLYVGFPLKERPFGVPKEMIR
jgi:glycosyltransferase involved in cell wall biosynthesis